MSDLKTYLIMMAEKGASDLFLSVGSPPYLKIDGATRVIESPPLPPGAVKNLAFSAMRAAQQTEFEQKLEANFAFVLDNGGRYRINVYYQRGDVAMAIRMIKTEIPELETLGLPTEIVDLTMLQRGLILIVGAGGSGKSTTMASMIKYRAAHADDHILTIEDPIEFNFGHQRSLIDQREVGIDTLTFGDALRNAMRESPDVIMIGEIRDSETAQHAIAYAESGHLCISTMHANNANQAIERLLNYFPEAAHKQVLLDLSLHLEAIVSQRLVRSMEGKRVLAVELLRQSGYISELIRLGRLNQIKHEMGLGNQDGVITFDQSLFELYRNGKISRDEALHNADSHTDLALTIRLAEYKTIKDAPGLTLSQPNIYGSYD